MNQDAIAKPSAEEDATVLLRAIEVLVRYDGHGGEGQCTLAYWSRFIRHGGKESIWKATQCKTCGGTGFVEPKAKKGIGGVP